MYICAHSLQLDGPWMVANMSEWDLTKVWCLRVRISFQLWGKEMIKLLSLLIVRPLWIERIVEFPQEGPTGPTSHRSPSILSISRVSDCFIDRILTASLSHTKPTPTVGKFHFLRGFRGLVESPLLPSAYLEFIPILQARYPGISAHVCRCCLNR